MTAPKQQYDNSGIMFRNDDKSGERDRDYKGECIINGAEFWMSGWIKTGARGKFMTFSFKPKDAAKPATTKATAEDLSDPMPF